MENVLVGLRARAAANGGTWWKPPRSCSDPDDKRLAVGINGLFKVARWAKLFLAGYSS